MNVCVCVRECPYFLRDQILSVSALNFMSEILACISVLHAVCKQQRPLTHFDPNRTKDGKVPYQWFNLNEPNPDLTVCVCVCVRARARVCLCGTGDVAYQHWALLEVKK